MSCLARKLRDDERITLAPSLAFSTLCSQILPSFHSKDTKIRYLLFPV
ncbi:hypothetical protein JMJ77_0004322, partial [Colletotrichum scovillei]